VAGSLHVLREHNLSCRRSREDQEHGQYSLDYSFLGEKRDEYGADIEELFAIFSSASLLFHIYPYFREFVHSTTHRMGWPGVVLPLGYPSNDQHLHSGVLPD
jgi:hypothetical protein